MMSTDTAAVDRIAYSGAIGASMAHNLGCHRCGDTDYECEPGRALRLAAWRLGEVAGRDLRQVARDVEAIAGRVEVSALRSLGARTACMVEAWEVIGHGAGEVRP